LARLGFAPSNPSVAGSNTFRDAVLETLSHYGIDAHLEPSTPTSLEQIIVTAWPQDISSQESRAKLAEAMYRVVEHLQEAGYPMGWKLGS
jgi:hypothetical protein